MSKDYLRFEVLNDSVIKIIVVKDGLLIGKLEKIRVGKWMSWCLLLFDSDFYLSASCLDQVRVKMRELNSLNKGLCAYG